MLEVGGAAFTAAIATVVVLFYLVYSFLLKKQSPVESDSNGGQAYGNKKGKNKNSTFGE